MGPNSKKRSRSAYVKHRLKTLDELMIPRPPQNVIDRMLDEKHMTEIGVDAIFHDIILRDGE